MKHLIPLLLITGSFLITGCENSSFTSGKNVTTILEPTDPVTGFNPQNPNDPNYVSNHCSDVVNQKHQFYGYMKNVLNRGRFQQLIESQTNCKSYNGWITYTNGNSTFYQYEKHEGTANCNWWSQKPMGITIGFFKGYSNTATIAIDATGDGWAYSGQGFPVKRMILGGQIDCSQPDLTISSRTSHGWLQITVEKEYGNKNAPSMRASINFNGVDLGKQQLIRQ